MSSSLLTAKSLAMPALLSEHPISGEQGHGECIRALSKAIVQGDEAAFARFYEQYSGRVFRFVLVLTRGHEDAAWEVQQTVMIKAARRFRVFETEAQLWAWLSQVARNAYVDLVRRETRAGRMMQLDGADAPAKEAEAPAPLLESLDEALAALSEEERRLIESIYFEDKAQGEVATADGRTVKAIESKLARVRAKLRRFILERLHK